MIRVALIAALLAPGAALAQTPAPIPSPTPATPAAAQSRGDGSDLAVGKLIGDLITPESPGFVALGVAPNEITHPETTKRLALGVLNGLDQQGNFQTGFAFQFSPALLFAGNSITHSKYLRSAWTRAATRFEVMAAVAKGSDQDKSARATLGFVWTPVSLADPYANAAVSRCFDRALAGVFGRPTGSPDDVEEALQAEASRRSADIAACRKRYSVSSSDDLSLQLGFAPLFISESGETDDFQSQGFVANGQFRIGVRRLLGLQPDPDRDDQIEGQLVLAASYRTDESVPDPDLEGAYIERDRFNAGGRMIFGTLKSFIVGVEALYQKADYAARGKDNYVTYAASLDYPISEGVWVGLSAGGAAGKRVGGNDAFIGTRLRFGWGDKPSVGDPLAR